MTQPSKPSRQLTAKEIEDLQEANRVLNIEKEEESEIVIRLSLPIDQNKPD